MLSDVPVPPVIVSVGQVSQSQIRVNMTVTDTQCVGMYQAIVSQDDSQVFVEEISTSPSIVVGDLDVCQYSYSTVGLTVTAGGVRSANSSTVPFTPDLSGIKIISLRTSS